MKVLTELGTNVSRTRQTVGSQYHKRGREKVRWEFRDGRDKFQIWGEVNKGQRN